MKHVLKSWRVIFLATVLVFSLLFVTNAIPVNKGNGMGFGNGLDYGLDFAGGTQLQLRLETEVTSDVMSIEKGILENRLNSLGLKDIPVRPWGKQYILVQIAGATTSDVAEIEEILKQQAKFEERIDGELAVTGDEIRLDLTPTGALIDRSSGGYRWSVSVSHNPEGACRFGKVAEGKMGRPVDIFIDRPEDTVIVLSEGTTTVLGGYTSESDESHIFYSDTALEIITNRSRITVVSHTGDAEKTLSELKKQAPGAKKAILAGDETQLSESLRNRLEEAGLSTRRMPQGNESISAWVTELTGLQSSPRLNFNTRGECVYNAQITGTTLTLEAARKEIRDNQVLLTSGNLPAELTVESRSSTPPTLGRKFLRYAFYTALLAELVVAFIIYLRYARRPFLVVPIALAGICEVIIILGFASVINWQLDLPAVAGVIAAVGTGVDHFIVITDETLKRGGKEQKKIISMAERIRRAFFIIFTAAATVVAAMLPLLAIGAGMLKGFAFTTIMGVFVGVMIVRPAYAKIISQIVE